MAKPKWDRHTILAELRRRGMTLAKLAELRGISPGGFRTIWSRPNQKSEQAIADFLSVPAEELFPDRYPKTTNRIYDSAKWGALESQKSDQRSDRTAA